MAFAVVTYSVHAQQRMTERHISKRQIELALSHPDRLSLNQDRLIAERDTEMGNVIRVVYVEQLTDEGECAHGVTAIRIAGK